MLNVLKDRKFHKQLLLVIGLLIVMFLPIFIKNNGVLVYYGDSFEEFYQFYIGGWEKVRNLNLNLWDWSIGLGGNVFGYSDTFFTSPFFWISVLFPKEWMPVLFTILNMLKLLVTFTFSYTYFSSISNNQLSRFIGSIIITFSGWVFFYNHYSIFLDAYLWFPLILYYAEMYLQNGKFKGFVITYFILTIQSYYFAYMFVPYVCLYGLFRYIVLNNDSLNWKNTIIMAFKYLGMILLGIGIGAFILLPSIYTLMGNPRLSESYSLFSTINIYDAFKFITSFFVPTFSRLNPNYFVNIGLLSDLGWGYGCSLFSFLITIISLPLLVFIRKKFETKMIFGAYAIFIIMVIFPIFWLVFQGSIDTRWFYMIIFFNAYVVVYIFDSFKNNNNFGKYLSVSSIVILIIMWLLFCVAYTKQLNDTNLLLQLFYILVIESVIILGYFVLFRINIKFVFIILTIEALFSGLVHFYFNPPREYTLFEQFTFDQCVLDYTRNDQDFYRVIYDNDDFNTANEPFARDFAGISFYYSIYNYQQEDYLNRYKTTWSMPMVQGRNRALNMLGAKYWYTKNFINQVPFGYESIETDCNMTLFKNQYPFTLAYLESDTLSANSYAQNSYLEQDLLMEDYLFLEESNNVLNDYNIFESKGLTHVGAFATSDDNMIDFAEPLNNSNIYIVPKEYNPAIGVQLLIDDSIIFNKNFYQVGYLDIYIDGNTYVDSINLNFEINKYGEFDLYIENLDNSYYQDWYNDKRVDFINDIEILPNKVNMQIASSIDQYVVTSIPYDEGWSLYIDGTKANYLKGNYGFIAFEIDSGVHSITLKYTPKWLTTGVLVSAISILIFVFMIFKESKTQ